MECATNSGEKVVEMAVMKTKEYLELRGNMPDLNPEDFKKLRDLVLMEYMRRFGDGFARGRSATIHFKCTGTIERGQDGVVTPDNLVWSEVKWDSWGS